jgi:ankyrin repeat protein
MWLLDEKGADVNGTTPLGSTPLHYASSLDILTTLMDRGANPTLSDNRGLTPLMGQACRGKPDNVGRLLEDPRVRAAIDVLDEIGFTSLHWACIRFEEDFATSIILLLLQAGGNPAITNNHGETPATLIRNHHLIPLITIALLEQVPDAEKASLLVKAPSPPPPPPLATPRCPPACKAGWRKVNPCRASRGGGRRHLARPQAVRPTPKSFAT